MDFYAHVYTLSEDKLIAEIEKLNKQLFKLNPSSPMYNQLLNMIDTARNAHAEMIYASRFKNQEDKIIEIGTIEEHIVTPDYSKQELLLAIVEQYTNKEKE
jgi:hypothetical protein